MVEAVGPLHCPPECEVARQEHVGSVEGDEQEAVRRPRSDPRNARQGSYDGLVRHARQPFVAQAAIDEALRDRPQGCRLAR
jgi:hypothetical protein